MEETKTKVCPKCGRELPYAAFYRNTRRKDGCAPYCKECTSENRKTNNASKVVAVNPKFAGVVDKTLQEEVAERLNELRARGWEVECAISHVHVKKL